jgi:hypothetical protein
MNKRRVILPILLLLAVIFAACEPLSAVFNNADRPIYQIINDYKSWPMVAEPRNVTAYLLGLCRMPTRMDDQFGAAHKGMISVYVNPLAVEAITRQENPVFPVGSIIVKEKLVEGEGTAWGLMIKHTSGSNPSGGDWEYLYIDSDRKVWRGDDVQHCQACHQMQPTDSVFVDRYRQ